MDKFDGKGRHFIGKRNDRHGRGCCEALRDALGHGGHQVGAGDGKGHRDDMGERDRNPTFTSMPSQHRIDRARKSVAAGGREQGVRQTRVVVAGEWHILACALSVANADKVFLKQRVSRGARGTGEMAANQGVDITAFEAGDAFGHIDNGAHREIDARRLPPQRLTSGGTMMRSP